VTRIILKSDIAIPSKHVALNGDGSVSIQSTLEERDAVVALLRSIADDFEREAEQWPPHES